MFELRLAGHSASEIDRIAREEWGYRTRKTKRTGGKPLALCAIYRILCDPFYAGLIRWKGRLYPGNPQAGGDAGGVRGACSAPPDGCSPHGRQKRSFAFTGLIALRRVRAVDHRRADGPSRPAAPTPTTTARKRGPGPRCPEPGDRTQGAGAPDRAIPARRSPSTRASSSWRSRHSTATTSRPLRAESARGDSRLRRPSPQPRLSRRELTGLRLRQLLSDEEFTSRARALDRRGHRGWRNNWGDPAQERGRFEPVRRSRFR